jgi:predicted nucleotidyltransferase
MKIIADFTEYNPLHNGHLHCMRTAQETYPEGVFVAILPGLFERSGRGLPYIMTRQARAASSIDAGADVVVEGPPMGIMGSGQYSLCLAKMFQSISSDYMPRGYKPLPGFETILHRIQEGIGVAPKPFKMVDMENGQVLLEGRLHEDNYVIASLSRSMTKIHFPFKDKFLFVERLEGVSGTIIRDATKTGQYETAMNMLPETTLKIMKDEIENQKAPLHEIRDEKGVLDVVNQATPYELKMFRLLDERTRESILEKRPFDRLDQVKSCVARGFSRHHPARVISSLEARIDKIDLARYMDNYPPIIRVLNYKNKEVLKEFKKRIPHRRLEICQ